MTLSKITEQLIKWWDEVNHYTKDMNKTLNYSTKESGDTILFYLYTANNRYQIVAKDNYLGCQVSNRRADIGESWTRGRDLPDGKFSKETWDDILKAIAVHELTGVAGIIK